MLAKLPVSYTIDHMGRVKAADGLDQLPFKTLIELMQRDEKCWVKVCGCERVSSAGPPFTDAVPFARRIVETAPDRVIWGTDWPHPNVKVMPNDGDLVDLVPLFAPEPELQQKILVDNPARLFEFDDDDNDERIRIWFEAAAQRSRRSSALAAPAAVPQIARAQKYPDRPVRLILPFGAGRGCRRHRADRHGKTR